MSSEGKHCEEGGFEELQEEVLTYALSELSPAPLSKPRRASRNKNLERHKLQLLGQQSILPVGLDLKEINKQLKRMENGRGKVIPIGGAIFRSNFECGNLASVQMVASNTYSIDLERETNSNRISAWFYFSVEGLRGEAHFIVRGFSKSSSLYSEGMKVCYRDVKELTKWRRGGSRITYTNSIINDEYQSSYQLRFSHFFRNNQHTCIQFAYAFPYGLKKLYGMIGHLKEQANYSVLAKSFNGLDIPLLTIGNAQSKEVIVLSARVHPGETVSSFIMQGFLRELVGDNQFGRLLRGRYLFKVVPMLNPDGVTAGNYRFSGAGCDLNRKWRSCKEGQHPEVYHMRELIRTVNKQRRVVMYIDMHGHSRKKNVFFYGCCEKSEDVEGVARPKQFPFLMEKLHDAYKYENCCFNVQKDKEGTARVTVWKDLKIDYVYTLESTFCGPQFGPNYLQADYERIGKKLCEGIAIFFYSTQEKEKHLHEYKSIEKMSAIREKAFTELLDSPALLQVGDEDDSGSESQPQTGQIPEKDRFPQTGLPKPQSLLKELKSQSKPKKMSISKKFFSQSSISQKRGDKIKSEVSLGEDLARVQGRVQVQEQALPQQAIKISCNKFDKVEIKIANTLTTFELDSLRASSLYQKNVRVHSLTRHPEKPSSHSRRMVNPFAEEGAQQRLRVNLMHGRQGVQYRRVRKLAEQTMRKDLIYEEEGKVVKQLPGSQFYLGQTERSNNQNSIIVPRFEQSAQQRHRKASADALRRGNDFKKISINGDQFSVRCKGRQIYL